MAEQGKNKSNEPPRDTYMLSRGFAANTRQALQHYLFKDGFNYLLHPKIPIEVENLRIAEIGVGTGIWMIETARMLPTARINGLDISFEQCPPKEFLPLNITFHRVDCLAEAPDYLIEQYDIIHVQLFLLMISRGNPVPVLQNLLKMLKPGGYIQWGEWDFATWEIERIPSAKDQTNNELREILDYAATRGRTITGPNFFNTGWVTHLHQTFREHGLQNVTMKRHLFTDGTPTLLTDTMLMANTEMSYNVMDKLGGGQGDTVRGFIADAAANRGTTACQIPRVITVGQKPSS